jgi:integral membrane protein
MMLKLLKVIGIIEGVSLLLLFGVAMPIKYGLGEPIAVEVVGMLHGVLFIAYIILVLIVGTMYRWRLLKIGLAMLASVVPFGTFYADKKMFQLEQ